MPRFQGYSLRHCTSPMQRRAIRSPRFGCVAAPSGFSLIEVVVALGIFIFAMVAINGLFFVGLDANKSSSEQIQAANVASLLISTRRSLPTNAMTNTMTMFALPPLNVVCTGTTVRGVATDGTAYVSGTSPYAAYDVYYQGGPTAMTGPHLAQVHLLLSWPPSTAASPTPSNNPSTRFEVTTQIALP